MIHLILAGSGTSVPKTDRGSPCLVMRMDGRIILFDIGPGAVRRLVGLGIPPHRIERIFLSHFHPDHTADLIHLFFYTRHPPVLEARQPIALTGPKGTQRFLGGLQQAFGPWLDLPPELLVVEELDINDKNTKRYEKYNIKICSAHHTPHSLAYRVEGPDGENFVYAGDTGYSDEIVALADGTDLLILESAFPVGSALEGHLTPAQAGQMADRAGAKRLLLIHFYPAVLQTDITAQCRKTYSGELVLGRDSLHMTLK